MKRPRVWLRVLVWGCALLFSAQYVVLTLFAPRYVLGIVQYAAGGELVAERARLLFPLTTTLNGLHFLDNTPASSFQIQQATIRPLWFSAPSKTIRLSAVEIEQPTMRLTRTASGRMVWPALPQSVKTGKAASTSRKVFAAAMPVPSFWQINIDAIKVTEGVIELVDERTAPPFHGMIDHLSFVAGPVTMPFERMRETSIALRAELVGPGGRQAPFYCSGWMDFSAGDLQASCKVDPIELAAFRPSADGAHEGRVSTATLTATSQWSARAHHLHAKVQLVFDRLEESDFSYRGRTILDMKQLAGAGGLRLSGELQLTGSLDHPADWRAEFLPGDEQMQRLVKRLLSRQVEVVRVPIGFGSLSVNLTPSSQSTMTGIEAASREIDEALEILIVPSPEESPNLPSGRPSLTEPSPPKPSVAPVAPPSVESTSPRPTAGPAPVAPAQALPPETSSDAGQVASP